MAVAVAAEADGVLAPVRDLGPADADLARADAGPALVPDQVRAREDVAQAQAQVPAAAQDSDGVRALARGSAPADGTDARPHPHPVACL